MPSPDRLDRLARHLARSNASGLASGPGNRAAAEAGVAVAYGAAGLSPPLRVVWFRGPDELHHNANSESFGALSGAKIHLALDRYHIRLQAHAAEHLGERARAAYENAARRPNAAADDIGSAMIDALAAGSSNRPPRLWRSALRALAILRGRGDSAAFWSMMRRNGIEPRNLSWVALHCFLADDLELHAERAQELSGLAALAANAAFILPYERACLLLDRPAVLRFDAQHRLHCGNGPALSWDDGWSYFAWKGIPVPRKFVERPDTITVDAIDAERNIFLRRCMIEIVTPQKFVAMGGANRIGEDDCGVLWRRTWWSGDAWAAVEVVNGSPEPDGTYKHYFLQVPPEMRSPRAAVAWTYGMSEPAYMRLSRRT